jgi:hypothetical protein
LYFRPHRLSLFFLFFPFILKTKKKNNNKMNNPTTSSLFTTVSQLHMPDDERATLQAAIESSLAQLTTPAPVPHNFTNPSNQYLLMAKSMLSPH